MDPWYSGRLKLEEVTIAEALKMNGYVSGHTGKWHMAIDHNAFPQPEDQGFNFTRHHLGASAAMRPHRLTGFASIEENDPYKLDEKGFPKDQMTLDALDFMKANKDKPFFFTMRLGWCIPPSIAGAKHCSKSIVRNLDLITRVIRQVGHCKDRRILITVLWSRCLIMSGKSLPIWKIPRSPASRSFPNQQYLCYLLLLIMEAWNVFQVRLLPTTFPWTEGRLMPKRGRG